MKRRYQNPLKIVVATALASMLLLTGSPLTAGEPGQKRIAESGERLIRQLPAIKVTITKKTIEAVVTSIGDRFSLSGETIITDLAGKQVSIRKMLVPCDAEITYEGEGMHRKAHRIKMINLEDDNRWQWQSDLPE